VTTAINASNGCALCPFPSPGTIGAEICTSVWGKWGAMKSPSSPAERGGTVFLWLPQQLSLLQRGGATLDHCKNQIADSQWEYSFVCGHPVSDWMSNWSRTVPPADMKMVNVIHRKPPSGGGVGNHFPWAPSTATGT
jgi:hypothetical protein